MTCPPVPQSYGQVLVCSSTTRPLGYDLYTGRVIYELDTQRVLAYDGTGWVILSEPLQTFASGSITVVSTTGTITTVGTKSMFYKRGDGWVDVTFSFAITTNGTGASAVQFTLPITQAVSGGGAAIGTGRETAVSGKSLQVVTAAPGASVGQILNYDNTYPAANGAILQGVCRYPMTTRYS